MINGRVDIKPMSVNVAWAGRRFKTGAYQAFEAECFARLKPYNVPVGGKLQVYFRFGFSNPRQDWDGPIKPFQDILQKKYGFDDNRVYRAIIDKVIVPKGKEYIYFEITELNDKFESC